MKLGLLEWMFLIFFVLKLVGEIDWSWWWVTCPMWIIPLIYLVLFAGFLCGEIYKKNQILIPERFSAAVRFRRREQHD